MEAEDIRMVFGTANKTGPGSCRGPGIIEKSRRRWCPSRFCQGLLFMNAGSPVRLASYSFNYEHEEAHILPLQLQLPAPPVPAAAD